MPSTNLNLETGYILILFYAKNQMFMDCSNVILSSLALSDTMTDEIGNYLEIGDHSLSRKFSVGSEQNYEEHRSKWMMCRQNIDPISSLIRL
jgi:hypothetical protein